MSKTPHSYVYVPKDEFLPVKQELLKLIDTVKQSVQNQITFRIKFIGSSSRDMITKDLKGNKGFDFDLNIIIDPKEKNNDPKYLKNLFMNAFNKYVKNFNYDYCEDSTSVLTIKAKDHANASIIHSADFGIVRVFNGQKQFIKNNKDKQTYCWDNMPKYPQKLSQMADWCEKHNYWEEVKSLYLQNKNQNTDPLKKSREIYANTINQVYQKHFK